MIEGLKPYPATKDSGVPWLGSVPEHWDVQRLKTRVSNIVEQTAERQDDELYLALENVESWTGRIHSRDETSTFDSQVKRFRARDVLFGKLRPYLAKIARPHRSGVCAGEFFVLRARSNQTRSDYLERLMRSAPVIDAVSSSTFGAKMPRADWYFVGNLRLAFPTVAEQRAIVRFLDHAERRIQRYIRAKRKLIALLNEQKQAIVQHAVTRGLDPNVRLKPSDVEWLGDMPEHWDIRPAKFIYREIDERSLTGREELLSVSHITGVTPRRLKNVTMFMASSYVGHKLCRPGDLVVNTMWAWMAALGVARQVGIVSPAYGVYRPLANSPLLPGYADLLLRSKPYVNEYNRRSTGIQSSRLRLYPEQFLRVKVACPPLNEQESIVRYLEIATASVQRAVIATNREIELLNEYRTSLVADVVTGKLDVREAAAQLRDDTEGPELLAADASDNEEFAEGLDEAAEEAA